MTAAPAIVRMGVRQVLGLKRLIGFAILALSPTLIFLISSTGPNDESDFELFLGLTLGTHFIVAVPIVTLILAASALGDERRDQTLSFLALRPISRVTIAGAKYGAAFLAPFILTGAGALGLAVTYGALSGDWGYVVPLLVGTAIATAVYAAVYLPLGYLSERSTLIGLAFTFIWESGIVSAVGSLATTSPWRIGFSAMTALAPDRWLTQLRADDAIDFALGSLTPGVPDALLRAAIIVAAGLAITTVMLRRRDLA
jgi:ABC-type transport system involved in multi-copper enzyme maturation permease subunit